MKAKKILSMALVAAIVGSTPVTAHAASVRTMQIQKKSCYKAACIVISNIGNYCPDIEIPDINQPDAGTPDVSQPGTSTPDNSRPGTGAPDSSQPDAGTPDNSQPDAGTPDNSQPDAGTPDTSTPAAPETPDTAAPGETNLSYAEQVVKLVNAERAKAGLAALTMQSDITSAANVRAKEIKQSFSHTRPNGSSFSSVLKEQGVSFRGAGENIAYGQKTPEQVMEGWMNSSGHRANILNANFKNIGVGYYQDARGVNYWVQLFTY